MASIDDIVSLENSIKGIKANLQKLEVQHNQATDKLATLEWQREQAHENLVLAHEHFRMVTSREVVDLKEYGAARNLIDVSHDNLQGIKNAIVAIKIELAGIEYDIPLVKKGLELAEGRLGVYGQVIQFKS